MSTLDHLFILDVIVIVLLAAALLGLALLIWEKR